MKQAYGALGFLLLTAFAPAALCAEVRQWTNVGPEGGGISVLAVDPQDSSTVYAATGTGVFKSLDAGASWSNAGMTGYSVGGLAIDSQSTLYAWTRSSSGDVLVTAHIFKSADRAATWNEVAIGELCRECHSESARPRHDLRDSG